MGIRQAAPADRPALKALWMAAFHDSEEATDFYFIHRHQDAYMLVEEEAGQIRGMLSMLPLSLCGPGGCRPGRYLFAIATDERYRGQGISSRLMLEAERLAKEAGCAATLLVPASAKLFRFYGKRGYAPCFDYRYLSVSAAELPPAPEGAHIYKPTAREMLAIRDSAFMSSRLYARWDEAALDYVRLAATVYEAALLAFTWREGRGYAYGEWDGNSLIIKDFALSGIKPVEALALLHPQLRAMRYELRLPAGSPLGVTRPYGLIKAFEPLDGSGEAPYLGLGKD